MYSQLIKSDINGLTVSQLIEALKTLPQTALVTTDGGHLACKVSLDFVKSDSNDTVAWVSIYTEKT